MKRLIILIGFLLLSASAFAQSLEDLNSETTLIFVRHAEKVDDGTKDPSLNVEGNKRALRLAGIILNNYNVSAIYSTPYKRSRETAAPIADSLNVEIQEYGLSDPEGLVQSLKKANAGSTALIVGHSNTTPLLVNISLGEQKFKQLDEKSYGDLFVVTINSNGIATVEKLSY